MKKNTLSGKRIALLVKAGCLSLSLSFLFMPDAYARPELPAAGTKASTGNQNADRSIKGVVVDEKGGGLPGVNVLVKGTQRGVITDVNGNFDLNVEEGAILVFSFVGYVTQEVTINNQTSLQIAMAPNEEALSEVVVIGYGTRKKTSVTSSVTKLENKNLEQVPSGRIENVLAGRLAGVNISNSRSRPGEAPSIRVRGWGSISAGNNPLIVIDGFPGGDLSTLNMNDVESVEVLKDASSTAIYGSRGASGVILVTTKRGTSGKTTLNVNSYFGISKAMLFDDWLTGKEWYDYLVRYQNREFVWAGGDPTLPMNDDNGKTPRPLSYQVNSKTYTLPQTVWQDEVMQTAPIQSYNISASGGSEKSKYYVSALYLDEGGTLKTSWYKKFGVRANVDMKINKFINLSLELSPTYSKRRLAGSNMLNLSKYPPFVGTERLNGRYPRTADYIPSGHSGQASPYTFLYGTESFNNYFSNIGRAALDINIANGLTFKTSIGNTIGFSQNNNWSGGIGDNGVNSNGSLGDTRTINSVNENILNYTKTFNNDHDFGALLGSSYQRTLLRSLSMAAVANSFNNDKVKTLNNALINASATTASNTEWGLISYFARVNYGYKGKYLVEASFRRDGSSRFGPDNKWGNFPSVSAAWRVSEESFLKDIPAISELKLKASYGITGNFNIGDFQYLGTVANSLYSPGNITVNGIAQTSMANNQLSWEKTKGINLGFELSLIQNRINLAVDFYRNRTNDMLYNVNTPAITGFTSTISNMGEIENKGIDIELNTRNIARGDFRWNTAFNFSHNKNQVLDLGGVDERVNEYWSMGFLLRKGVPMFSYYGYKLIGVFQNQNEIDSKPHLAGTKPGNPIVLDANNDGKIDPADRVVLGSFMPKSLLGMTNDFSYKNFDVSIFMQASLGSKMFNVESQSYEGNTLGAMRRSRVENQWWSEAEPGDGKTPALALSQLFQYNTNTDYYLENASFLSVRTVNIGYTMPKVAQKLKMSNFKIYASLNNLLLIKSKLNASYNPEGTTLGEVSGINSTPGVNMGSEPINRTYVLGINFGF
ncbi:TonB-dependent receptor [Ravibacter arvi]|uniref:TonB-dependent receptor n=1 Tax=Ravibacter arvi TaxID=2051041 RepID=A0ABP8M1Y8_9BACT